MSAGLRQLAEAATPGPWEAITLSDSGGIVEESMVLALWPLDSSVGTPVMDYSASLDAPDAAFIAAANPRAVLALLDKCDALSARVAAVEALCVEWERSDDRTWVRSLGDDLRDALNQTSARLQAPGAAGDEDRA